MALVTVLALPVLAGCGSSGTPPPTSSSPPSGTSATTAAPSKTAPAATESSTGTVISSVVTYGWRWPNDVNHPASVHHTYAVPPLPVLRAVSVGRHESEHPGYDRISFTFTGTFPSYDLLWVRTVTTDPKGEPLALAGDGVLRIRFTQADAHDANGTGTVVSSPPRHVGYPAIEEYAQAGDFEGVLTFAVSSFRTIHESNAQTAVRTVEVTTSDGAGGVRCTVAVDIQTRGLGGTSPYAD